MNTVIIRFIYNIALLLSVGYIFSMLPLHKVQLRLWSKLGIGVILGILGILIMMYPFEFTPGVRFDARSILICITGLFFGLIPTVLASVISVGYRLFAGGPGAIAGSVGIITFAVIGLLWHKHYYLNLINRSVRHRILNLYLFGFVVHVVYLSTLMIIPWPLSIQSLQTVGLPIIIVFPLGTMLMGMVMMKQVDYHNAFKEASHNRHRLETLVKKAPYGIIVYDKHGIITDINAYIMNISGFNEDDLLGKSIAIFSRSNPQNDLLERLCITEDEYIHFEEKVYTKRGENRLWRIDALALNDDEYFGFIRDITELTNVQTELEESENQLRSIFDNAGLGICYVDDIGRFINANRKFCTMLGYTKDEVMTMSLDDVLSENIWNEMHPQLTSVLQMDDASIFGEMECIAKNKDKVFTEYSASHVHRTENAAYIVLTLQDITRRKTLETDQERYDVILRNQQKLESIGTLAGGVAHEINNPINGIMNYAQIIHDDAQDPVIVSEYSTEIINESRRIASIVKDLLQFSRDEKSHFSNAHVSDIINSTLSLVRSILKNDQVMIKINIPENLPVIECRSQQIQQVIMNMITNARDALNTRYPDYDENKIIQISCQPILKDHVQFIRVQVKDHGCGIPDEIAVNIFDPFFSTKPRDRGTGLGLAITFGIVEEHGGTITYNTKVGEYTEFNIDLPLIQPEQTL